MKYVKTALICVAVALAMVIYLLIARDEVHVNVYCYKSTYYAIIKHGPLIDTTALLWVKEDDKWLVCYLDHEINPGVDFKVIQAERGVIVCTNNVVFASYDHSSRKIVYSETYDYVGFPNQVVWKDDKEGYWSATVVSIGAEGVGTNTPQQLTEDYWEVKCICEIGKAIKAGQIVSLED